ncbi:MAG: hypothetical protein RJB12_945 [Pseudomonadota bacterium]
MNGKQFGEWLDANGMSVEAASSYFGVTEGSIYKWRSTPGVPERKLEWVRMRMAAYMAPAPEQRTETRLALNISNDQLQEYIDASVAHQMRLEDWAIHALDEAAREDRTLLYGALDPVEPLRVADRPDDFPRKKTGA